MTLVDTIATRGLVRWQVERKLIWNLLCPIPCENKTMQTSKCPEMRIVSRLAGTARQELWSSVEDTHMLEYLGASNVKGRSRHAHSGRQGPFLLLLFFARVPRRFQSSMIRESHPSHQAWDVTHASQACFL